MTFTAYQDSASTQYASLVNSVLEAPAENVQQGSAVSNNSISTLFTTFMQTQASLLDAGEVKVIGMLTVDCDCNSYS